ncbi:phosphopantetheine-binding protein [Nocardia rhamnosiphila]
MSYPGSMLWRPGGRRRSLGVPVADSGKVHRDARYRADPGLCRGIPAYHCDPDIDEIVPEATLDDLDLDCLAVLSIIVLVEKAYGLEVPGRQVPAARTSGDFMGLLGVRPTARPCPVPARHGTIPGGPRRARPGPDADTYGGSRPIPASISDDAAEHGVPGPRWIYCRRWRSCCTSCG